MNFTSTNIVNTLVSDCLMQPRIETINGKPVEAVHSRLCLDLQFISLLTSCCLASNETSIRLTKSLVSALVLRKLIAQQSLHMLAKLELVRLIFALYF